jgi:hypothetical protein
MIIINILRAIFGKKNKVVTPKPPVIYTPPKPTEDPKTYIDPLTGQLLNFNSEAKKEFYRLYYKLEEQLTLLKRFQKDKIVQAGTNIIGLPMWRRKTIEEQRAEILPLTEKARIICKDIVTQYNLEKDYLTKVKMNVDFEGLRWQFGSLLDNVAYNLPAPTIPLDKQNFDTKIEILDLRRKQLGQLQATFNKNEADFDKLPKPTNPTEAQIYEESLEKSDRLNKFNFEKEKLINDIKLRAADLVNMFNNETVTTIKQKYQNAYSPIRVDLNSAFNNFLSGATYTMSFPIDRVNPVDEAPQTGGGIQTQVGGNVGGNVSGNTPSEADLNTRPNQIGTVYPQWENKSYLTSEFVIYNGLTYKNAAQIVGNNNNTPDKDSRWVRV